jgi:hypothetical protein
MRIDSDQNLGESKWYLPTIIAYPLKFMLIYFFSPHRHSAVLYTAIIAIIFIYVRQLFSAQGTCLTFLTPFKKAGKVEVMVAITSQKSAFHRANTANLFAGVLFFGVIPFILIGFLLFLFFFSCCKLAFNI